VSRTLCKNGTERKGQASTVSLEKHGISVLLEVVFKRMTVIPSPLDKIISE